MLNEYTFGVKMKSTSAYSGTTVFDTYEDILASICKLLFFYLQIYGLFKIICVN